VRYTAPEIVTLMKAVSAICGSKGIGLHESPDTNPIKTTGAYEADE
jgi:hypothetical protein